LDKTSFDPQYAYASYAFDEVPGPQDFERYNLPLYDAKSFLKDGDVSLVGYIQEVLNYLPPGDFVDPVFGFPDCHGRDVWTFYDDVGISGQVSDQYTCFGGEGQLVMTGGTLEYECAEGFVEKVKATDDFLDGAGYIVWNLVNCGSCDRRPAY
jgi:hypothetical protein